MLKDIRRLGRLASDTYWRRVFVKGVTHKADHTVNNRHYTTIQLAKGVKLITMYDSPEYETYLAIKGAVLPLTAKVLCPELDSVIEEWTKTIEAAYKNAEAVEAERERCEALKEQDLIAWMKELLNAKTVSDK